MYSTSLVDYDCINKGGYISNTSELGYSIKVLPVIN